MLRTLPAMHMNIQPGMGQPEIEAHKQRLTELTNNALRDYTANAQLFASNYQRTMDKSFSDHCLHTSGLLAAAVQTNANQHRYMAQREVEHTEQIAQHVQRYALLEVALATESFDGFKRYVAHSQPAATATAPEIDIFQDDHANTLSLESIQAYMQDPDIRTASPLPAFPGGQIYKSDAQAYMQEPDNIRTASPLPAFPGGQIYKTDA